jgi:NAD(P)-dependent dehydrogenase (short-subunit alcohol dehydrogenase family)
MNVQGKAAIITGGGTGVGRATALQLARQGCHVLVNYSRSENDAEATAADCAKLGVKAIAHRADVADDPACRDMVAAAVRAFGRLDVLVNSAGTTAFIPFAQLDRVGDDDWQRIMGVNLLGPFHCARAAAKAMRDTIERDAKAGNPPSTTSGGGGGAIVNVSSIAGVVATGSCIPYACSKAALNTLTVALARTLAPHIRVNTVAPGFITGRWLEQGLGDKYEPVKEAFEQAMPLKKVCTPDDVAHAVMGFITGSDLVTGQVLLVDGGMSIAETIRI